MFFVKKHISLLTILLLAVFFLQSIPVEAESLLNNHESTYYILESHVKIENNSSTGANRLKLEVPIMAKINSPYQEIIAEEFSLEPIVINELDKRNRTAVFNISNIKQGSEITITAKYLIKISDANWLNSTNDIDLDHLKTYLSPETKIESNAPEIKAIAQDIINQVGNEDKAAIARAAFDYTRQTLKYNMSVPSVNQGALSALKNGAGSCVEFASLFVAISRAAGVPARIVNGFADKTAPLSKANLIADLDCRHQWAEFFLEGKGWIPVDPTLSNRHNSLFGKLPAGYYVAQNYGDHPIKGSYRGGNLSISFAGYQIRETESF